MQVTTTDWEATGTRLDSASLLGRADLRNICLLILGFACLLVLVPPTRVFPTDDDWVYARSVQDILAWHYKLPEAQATALGQTAWGALLSLLFGFSFTTLTAVTLIAAVLCLVLLYAILRQFDVSPSHSLLGTALLGCNPIFIYLSYSFMTDITFLAYMLGACLCFIRAFRTNNSVWLWVAAAITSLDYLTRQFSILLVPVALFYLWWSHKWRWRDAIAISALPVLTAIIYALWESSQAVPIAAYYAASVRTQALTNLAGYVLDRAQTFAIILATLGLCLAPLIRLPRRLLFALPIFAYIVVFQVRSTQLSGNPFPANGNIIDNTGFFACCNIAPSWSLPVWLMIGLVGAALISLHVVALVEQLSRWLHTSPWRNRTAEPIHFFYMLGAVLAAATLVVGVYSPFMFDRYFLPVLPMLMLPGLKNTNHAEDRSRQRNLLPGIARWLALVPLAAFALLGQHDYMTRATIRWQAADNLVSQGVPIEQVYAGFEWQGWHLYAKGEEAIRARGDYNHVPFPPDAVFDLKYAVMEQTNNEFTEIGSIPYVSWLEGGATRHMLVLKAK